jgi:hypothetical protein
LGPHGLRQALALLVVPIAFSAACGAESPTPEASGRTTREEVTVGDGQDSALVEALSASPEEARLTVSVESSKLADAEAALTLVVERSMAEIHHPAAEPFIEPFASFASDVECTDTKCSVWFDMADADAYSDLEVMERLVLIAHEELAKAGIDPAALSAGEGE